MVHLSSAPHSYAVFDSATAVALCGSCRRQPRQAHCTLWARRTITYQLSKLDAQQTNNQQAYTSVNSTGHVKAVDTINGIHGGRQPQNKLMRLRTFKNN